MPKETWRSNTARCEDVSGFVRVHKAMQNSEKDTYDCLARALCLFFECALFPSVGDMLKELKSKNFTRSRTQFRTTHVFTADASLLQFTCDELRYTSKRVLSFPDVASIQHLVDSDFVALDHFLCLSFLVVGRVAGGNIDLALRGSKKKKHCVVFTLIAGSQWICVDATLPEGYVVLNSQDKYLTGYY